MAEQTVHGTYAGFQQHRHTDPPTPACEACMEARRVYVRGWRRETGRVKGRVLTVMEMGTLTGKLGDFW